jgi:FkbM family methyltransferase
MLNRLLSQIARLAAKSTVITGYRGIGRIFAPLARFDALRRVPGSVAVGGGRRVIFPAFDYYWAPYLWTGKTYEPDVEMIFDRLAGQPNKVFVDCGANIGYWTVKLADPRYGFSRFYAVEANPYVYDYLERNVRSNGIECTLAHRAVAERSGQILHLGGGEGHAVGFVGEGEQGPAVETITIADLVRQGPPLAPDTLIVVKLDVEGSEVAAIRGASAAMPDGDFLYVFEDWSKSGMVVTEYLLREGWDVVGISLDGRLSRLASVEEAVAFNSANSIGYQPSNFIGCRSADRFFSL